MYSLDGRLSLQSLSEFESSRSWIADTVLASETPPALLSSTAESGVVVTTTTTTTTTTTMTTTQQQQQQQQENTDNPRYMGISLPRKLDAIFPDMVLLSAQQEKSSKCRGQYECKRPQVNRTSGSESRESSSYPPCRNARRTSPRASR
jgi:hypothetical protein